MNVDSVGAFRVRVDDILLLPRRQVRVQEATWRADLLGLVGLLGFWGFLGSSFGDNHGIAPARGWMR